MAAIVGVSLPCRCGCSRLITYNDAVQCCPPLAPESTLARPSRQEASVPISVTVFRPERTISAPCAGPGRPLPRKILPPPTPDAQCILIFQIIKLFPNKTPLEICPRVPPPG